MTKTVTYAKRFMLAVLALIVLGVAFLGIYIVFDYDAGPTASALIAEGAPGLTVNYDKGDYVEFLPEDGEIKAGIILYPGAKIDFEAYAPILEKLAEEGYLAVAVKVPGNLAFLNLHAADPVVERYPDVMHWYLAGHSLGGNSAASYIRANSFYFDGLIMIGAYSSADIANSNITKALRVLCINAGEDGILNREKYEKNKVNLPADFEEAVIQGGNHMQFADTRESKKDGAASISAEMQWEKTALLIADFVGRGIE